MVTRHFFEKPYTQSYTEIKMPLGQSRYAWHGTFPPLPGPGEGHSVLSGT